MTRRIDPGCPICKGVGSYWAPYYSDFAPRMEIYPCPECNEIQAPTKGELVFLAVCFMTIMVALVALAAWGGR